MKLIESILQEITDSSKPLSNALRKSKVLANILKNRDLELWINSELNGYQNDQPVPDYRKFSIHAKGKFQNIAETITVIIPSICLEDKYKEWATIAEIRESVDSIDDFLRSEQVDFGIPWPGDLIPLLQKKPILENHTITSGWKVITRSNFLNIQNTVRTKIMDFVLELKNQNPEFGDFDFLSSADDSLVMEANQVILNHFPNFSGNLVIGSNGIVQDMNLEITQNDFGELKEQLQKLGISEKELDELQRAILEDGKIDQKPFGKKVSAWIKDILSNTGTAALKIGESVASDLISKLLTNYYGL